MSLRRKFVNGSLQFKTCKICKKTYPRDEEHFYRSDHRTIKDSYKYCPNCEKIKHRAKGNKTEYNLITRRDIKAGEELTLHYTFYKPE